LFLTGERIIRCHTYIYVQLGDIAQEWRCRGMEKSEGDYWVKNTTEDGRGKQLTILYTKSHDIGRFPAMILLNIVLGSAGALFLFFIYDASRNNHDTTIMTYQFVGYLVVVFIGNIMVLQNLVDLIIFEKGIIPPRDSDRFTDLIRWKRTFLPYSEINNLRYNRGEKIREGISFEGYGRRWYLTNRGWETKAIQHILEYGMRNEFLSRSTLDEILSRDVNK